MARSIRLELERVLLISAALRGGKLQLLSFCGETRAEDAKIGDSKLHSKTTISWLFRSRANLVPVTDFHPGLLFRNRN